MLVKLIKAFFSFLYFLLYCCIVSTIRVNKDEYIKMVSNDIMSAMRSDVN